MSATISAGLARRIALGAQGFGARGVGARGVGAQGVSARGVSAQGVSAQGYGRASGSPVGIRQLGGLVTKLGLLQIDSVNVFERSHYMPVFSRLGTYQKADLDRLTDGPRLIEYWAHEASFIPVTTLPLMRWRMDDYRAKALADDNSWANANPAMLQWLRDELREKGALAASEIEHESNVRNGPWWGWSDVKIGLETLFRWGDVVSAGRTRFERRYGLPDQVLAPEVLSTDVPRADAVRQLMSISARAHGIGTAGDLADYFRLKGVDALPAIRALEESGELLPVTVDGWNKPAWLHRDARLPRSMVAAAILSPFDPVVWQRGRAERLFDFHYRIEIYTPAAKRVFGYYVMPVLLDDRVIGRLDLKNDRQAGILRVQAAWAEPNLPHDAAPRVAALLRQTAAWQNLPTIDVAPRGSFAAPLAAELAHPSP